METAGWVEHAREENKLKPRHRVGSRGGLVKAAAHP